MAPTSKINIQVVPKYISTFWQQILAKFQIAVAYVIQMEM